MNIQSENSSYGIIDISPEVIEVIANIAVTETKGVKGLLNNFASGNLEKIGKKYRGRGVKVDTREDSLKLSIYVTLDTDNNVHKVAESIQKNVSHAIRTMLDAKVDEVNVHIVNIVK
ncbi:Asp23/Gls24 family envelope stress response protein [Corticicoccus populi]|uniref:Asp23/Gls24 family envelope stress response protein n=1 Tax=Corticicoccus populi TaxID=1812821 RepID=A0ABW5WSC2_9STAP